MDQRIDRLLPSVEADCKSTSALLNMILITLYLQLTGITSLYVVQILLFFGLGAINHLS